MSDLNDTANELRAKIVEGCRSLDGAPAVLLVREADRDLARSVAVAAGVMVGVSVDLVGDDRFALVAPEYADDTGVDYVRVLQPFDPDASDGCSALALIMMSDAIPKRILREAQREMVEFVFGDDADAAIAACLAHDHRYYLGGSDADRIAADVELLAAWQALAGPDEVLRKVFVNLGFLAVRNLGGPALRLENVSWSFGGAFFDYSAVPAEECSP